MCVYVRGDEGGERGEIIIYTHNVQDVHSFRTHYNLQPKKTKNKKTKQKQKQTNKQKRTGATLKKRFYICEQVLFVRFNGNPAPVFRSMQFHYCTVSNPGIGADDAFVLFIGNVVCECNFAF